MIEFTPKAIEKIKKTFERDVAQSYCWRMRASLMGDSLAHYELALMRSRRN